MIRWLKTQWKAYEEGLLYLIFGVLTTAVDFLIYLMMTDVFLVNYLIGNVVAFLVAVLFAFVTNKLYVFKSHDFTGRKVLYEMGTFVGARLFSLGLNLAILYVFVDWVGMNDVVVKVMASVLVVLVNYIISKWLVFKDRKGEKTL